MLRKTISHMLETNTISTCHLDRKAMLAWEGLFNYGSDLWKQGSFAREQAGSEELSAC